MEKLFKIIFVSCIITNFIFAQQNSTKQNIFIELLGNGILYSFNYENLLKENISIRTGISVLPEEKTVDNKKKEYNIFFIPVIGNYLIGKSNHKLEIGLGANFGYINKTFRPGRISNKPNLGIYPTGRFGYAYQPLSNGVSYKIAYTPIIGRDIFHSIGISLGYSF